MEGPGCWSDVVKKLNFSTTTTWWYNYKLSDPPPPPNSVLRGCKTCAQIMKILCSENWNSALKNGNCVLRKCKFCTWTCNSTLLADPQNSLLRKWKFCTQKMEILPVPWKDGFSGPNQPIYVAAPKSKFCAKSGDRGIAEIGGRCIMHVMRILFLLPVTVEPVLKEHPTDHKKMWSVKTGGLWWQVQLYWNVIPFAENAWSVKTGGLSWQWVSRQVSLYKVPLFTLPKTIWQMIWPHLIKAS